MSVFDNKKGKNKAKLAFPDDNSIDIKKTPNSLDELKKAGRGGQVALKTKHKGKGGRPKEQNKEKREVIAFYPSKEQKEELKRRAKKANLAISQYILIKLFGVD